jgi:probable HAF family extracellular repeat protein
MKFQRVLNVLLGLDSERWKKLARGKGVGKLGAEAHFPRVAALILLWLVLPMCAVAQTAYSITDLGTLGGANSVPIWITNTGDVIGFSETAKVDGFGNPIQHAFLWSKGVMQDLGTLGGNNSFALGANDEGQVVGYADVPGGATSHATLWYKGTITDLGTLAGPDGFSYAQLINNRHQVVGGSTTADGTFRGFLWDRGAMTDLGTLGGPNSFGNGTNDRGQIVGGATVSDSVDPILGFPPYYGTLWDRGEIITLTPGVPAAAFNINNKSQVVGRILVPDPKEGGVAHAFLWQEGLLTDLGVPSGDDNSEAMSLNNHGQIVGDSGVGFIESYIQDRALLWDNGVRADLNALIPPDSRYHLIVAFDVNARMEIVVCAVQLSSGKIHAALLSPQPANVSGNAGASAAEATTKLLSLSPRAQRMLEHARRMKSGRSPGFTN